MSIMNNIAIIYHYYQLCYLILLYSTYLLQNIYICIPCVSDIKHPALYTINIYNWVKIDSDIYDHADGFDDGYGDSDETSCFPSFPKVSVADCASKCVSRNDVSVLLMSARVLLVDFSSTLPRPLTACPYDVVVEADD